MNKVAPIKPSFLFTIARVMLLDHTREEVLEGKLWTRWNDPYYKWTQVEIDTIMLWFDYYENGGDMYINKA